MREPCMMSDTKHPARQSIPAATVVIFRNAADGGPPQILMLVRSKTMAFAGGAAVFPGGRVDDADFALAKTLSSTLDIDEIAHRIAAIRETIEESGLALGVRGDVTEETARRAREMLLEHNELAPVLDTLGWTVALDDMIPFARWNPQNERIPRIFDTRFYLANLGTGAVEVAVDNTENSRLFWTTAQGALNAADRGELSIIFPTRRNLERLAEFPSFEDAAAQAARIPVRPIVPHFEERDGESWICIPDDAGYPVTGEPFTSAKRG